VIQQNDLRKAAVIIPTEPSVSSLIGREKNEQLYLHELLGAELIEPINGKGVRLIFGRVNGSTKGNLN